MEHVDKHTVQTAVLVTALGTASARTTLSLSINSAVLIHGANNILTYIVMLIMVLGIIFLFACQN